MRYYRANYFCWVGGTYRWRRLDDNGRPSGGYTVGDRYGPSEVPGTIFDDDQTGTGVNAPPVPKAGNANRGHCKKQFCVNDMKH